MGRARGLTGETDVNKAFDPQELHVRMKDDQLRHLNGLLPICIYCNKRREDPHGCGEVQRYVSTLSDARLAWSICSSCVEQFVAPAIERVRALANINKKLANDLIDLFLYQAPELYAEMAKRFRHSDVEGMEVAAYTFKRSAEHLGAATFRDTAYALERMARSSQMQYMAFALEELERQLHMLMEGLEKYREEEGELTTEC